MGNSWTANGNPTPMFWAETVSVQTNSIYEFSGWARNWSGPSTNHRLPFFELLINDVSVVTYVVQSLTDWEELSFSWNSEQSTSAKIELFEIGWKTQAAGGGNDFVLDDLAFETNSSGVVPEPSAIAMWSVIAFCYVGHRTRLMRKPV